jgi:mRNA-degrading endonuclease RelE of RelBE toxin-antitoxin system
MLAVEWTKPATKDLRRLDTITRARVEGAVARYAHDGIGDVRPLVNSNFGYRLRVGDWRVLFDLDAPPEDATLMTVHAVRPRGDAYK